MATVSEPVVTDPITVDAACQTTCPSIEEEVQEAASALDLCVKKDNFDTDSDSAIESGVEDSDIDVLVSLRPCEVMICCKRNFN